MITAAVPTATDRVRAFFKVEGLGNDFVLLDHRAGGLTPTPHEVRWLCDRHRGIGADGVLEVRLTSEGLPWMRLHNADGGLALMCGNGLRCVARFLGQSADVAEDAPFPIHTDSGPRFATLRNDGQIAVAMGIAANGGSVHCGLSMGACAGQKVDLGNPHWVHIDREGVTALAEVGPLMQHHPAFPDGVNVSVVRHLGPEQYDLSVWERGVGPTQACGSAACATAATIWWTLGGTDGAWPALTIHLPGGTLRLEGGPEAILMVGDARVVFSGTVRVPATLALA